MRQLTRLLRYVRPYGLQLMTSIVLMAIVGLCDAFRVLLVGPMLDRVLNPAAGSDNILLFTFPGGHPVYLQQFVPSHFHNAWTVVAFALVAATLLKGLADFSGTYLVSYAGFGLITDLRNHVYDTILRRSAAFFQRHTTGTLISTIINDIEKVQFAMSTVLAEFLQQFFILAFTAAVVVLLGGKLAWVLVLFIPVIFLSARRIGRRVRSTTRKGQDKLADIQNILHETISGNRIVKAFNMEGWESNRFRAAAKKLFGANLRAVAAYSLTGPVMDLVGAAAIAALLLLGRDYIKVGYFSAGKFVAFIIAVFKLYDPVRKFAIYNNNFQQALGASASIFGFLDQQEEVREKPEAVGLAPFQDTVSFEKVAFHYGESAEERGILSGIDLKVKRGEVLAIVGSSGAGKSTLVHLIPRFFDVSEGRIAIDGTDIRDVTLASLRAQIGIVTQETILFNDTVRNNIAYGRQQVSHAEVEAAAKAALAHDFILQMPEGYDSTIGEKGLRLSGGERQRIAIARAILKNAPILILDEATSALDSESEALVQSALANLMANRTVFVIAHRLSTVRRASRIVVLESGRITDIGTHEDLMSRLGTYRRLYDLQFVDLDPKVPTV
ncbi:MAG TPA: ABC transporter transmembrane domain-containing protein [Terriglobales bacterium]|nr:ABC transporter transmembrane domain-containing protein [Terriglobales bacterium]